MDRIEALRVFLNVAETGSFSGTARDLGISPGQVSKQIASLEERLKQRLFDRSTRAVRLTPEGTSLIDTATLIVERMDQLEAETATTDGNEHLGIVRLTAPVVYGERVIAPILQKYLLDNPRAKLRLSLTDRKTDLIEEGHDLAIRIGSNTDTELIGRKLRVETYHILASKTYLKNHGTPQHPRDLESHNCLIDLNRNEPRVWRFEKGGEPFVQKITGRLESDSLITIATAVGEGLGIAIVPNWAIENNTTCDDVQPLLEDWLLNDPEIWLLWPPGRHLPNRVRKVIDYLADHLK